MTILVGKNNNSNFYRFFITRDGVLKQAAILRNKRQATKDIYKNIVTDFFNNKKLIFIKYDTIKPLKRSEEYLGFKLQNVEEEKLNIYFTSKTLDAFTELEKTIEHIKCQDFYEYAMKPIKKDIVERFSLHPTTDERSSILYILGDFQNCYIQTTKQLGYYYRKSKNRIDEWDLWTLLAIIREYINLNIENNPYYEYNKKEHKEYYLIIHGSAKSYIEIKDQDLIIEIEKSRLLDDLWLVMHGVIEKMPLQEESISEKEELKRKRVKYLETCHKLNR